MGLDLAGPWEQLTEALFRAELVRKANHLCSDLGTQVADRWAQLGEVLGAGVWPGPVWGPPTQGIQLPPPRPDVRNCSHSVTLVPGQPFFSQPTEGSRRG